MQKSIVILSYFEHEAHLIIFLEFEIHMNNHKQILVNTVLVYKREIS
jgi:hypothetical protein